MRLFSRSSAFAIVVLLCAPTLFADDNDQLPGSTASSADIVFASGREFSIIRSGEIHRYAADAPEVLGLSLLSGDMVQTGADTFVEIQLLPAGSVLKLAENTSFLLKSVGGQGADPSASFGLVYGRVRAKVAKLTGSGSFSIRSGPTVAGVRGTDFGLDATVPSFPREAGAEVATPASPAVKVYCFSGEVAVYPSVPESSASPDAASPTGDADPGAPLSSLPYVVLQADEQAEVALASGIPLVERSSVDEETKSYWMANDFRATPEVPAPAGADLSVPSGASVAAPLPPAPAPAPEKVVELRYVQPDYAPYDRALAFKNGAIVGAGLFSLLGIGFQVTGVVKIGAGDYDSGAKWVTAGSVGMGAGVVALILGFLAAPVSSTPPASP